VLCAVLCPSLLWLHGGAPAGAATIANRGAVPSAGCGSSTVSAGDVEVTTNSGGVARTYIRHVPPRHDGNTPLPLVVSIHGLGEGANLHTINTQWGPRADAAGFVAVFPQGIGSRWSPSLGSADVAFIGHLLDEIESMLCIDTNRVYVTGFSLGAFMTTAVACAYADRVAAVAPVAGIGNPAGCSPSRPVPVLTFHGTVDTWVSYTPIPGNVAAWAGRNGCATPAAARTVPGDAVVSITKFTYPCAGNADVQFYSIENGGHAWPGSEFSRSIAAAVGYTTFAINASDLIWEFFRTHHLHPGIATYTAKFSADTGAVLTKIAGALGVPVADVVRMGVDALRELADHGAARPQPQPPNEGPYWVTFRVPDSDAADLEADAAAWGASGDELHNAGGRLILAVVYLAALGQL
jgi:polyhydroxybutyrate depolymerase